MTYFRDRSQKEPQHSIYPWLHNVTEPYVEILPGKVLWCDVQAWECCLKVPGGETTNVLISVEQMWPQLDELKLHVTSVAGFKLLRSGYWRGNMDEGFPYGKYGGKPYNIMNFCGAYNIEIYSTHITDGQYGSASPMPHCTCPLLWIT